MSNRAIRRAVERQAEKLAVKANKTILTEQAPAMAATASVGGACPPPPDTFHFQDSPDELSQTSDARTRANRENAQHSTGPRTPEGKAKSSMNAVKTGLTARRVLLPSDDAPMYYEHLDRQFAEYAPATNKEKALVQTIADTEWRLLRIAPLEAGIYAVGRRKLADQFADEPDFENRQDLITAEIFLTYRKDFSNLALQERRLRNQRKADIAELQQLQQARIQQRLDLIEHARTTANRCAKLNRDFHPAAHGFDFSFAEFAHFYDLNGAQYPLTHRDLDFDTVVAAYRAAQKEPQAA
jgi:hypothetical protein